MDGDLKSLEVQILIDLNSLKFSEFNIRLIVIQLARLFNCRITIEDEKSRLVVDASSFHQIISWIFATGKKYTIRAKGRDADVAIEAFRETFKSMTTEQMSIVYQKYMKKLDMDRVEHEPCDMFIESAKARVLFDVEGLHMRPSMQIVDKAYRFVSDVFICIEGDENVKNAKSLIEMSSINQVYYGDEILLFAYGPDADLAVRALKEFIETEGTFRYGSY